MLCAVWLVSPVTLFLTTITALVLFVVLSIAHAMLYLVKSRTMQLALVSGIYQPFYTAQRDTYRNTAQISRA